MKGKLVSKRYFRLKRVYKGYCHVLEWLEALHHMQKAISHWRNETLLNKKATIIQRVVRAHLAKKRVTMNRTRCVRFYWQRFCRLVKYHKSVEAARLIKTTLFTKVYMIQLQYRCYRFRKTLNDRIMNKKACIVQRFLRKVIAKNKHQFYMSKIK